MGRKRLADTSHSDGPCRFTWCGAPGTQCGHTTRGIVSGCTRRQHIRGCPCRAHHGLPESGALLDAQSVTPSSLSCQSIRLSLRAQTSYPLNPSLSIFLSEGFLSLPARSVPPCTAALSVQALATNMLDGSAAASAGVQPAKPACSQAGHDDGVGTPPSCGSAAPAASPEPFSPTPKAPADAPVAAAPTAAPTTSKSDAPQRNDVLTYAAKLQATDDDFQTVLCGEGPRTQFDPEQFAQKIAEYQNYKGTAISLFKLKLDEWSIANQSVSIEEMDDYIKKHYTVQYINGKVVGKVQIDVPIPIAVFGQPFSNDVKFTKLGMDLPLFAFIRAWHRIIGMYTTTAVGMQKIGHKQGNADDKAVKLWKLHEVFKKAALHCPVDFYMFEPGPEMNKKLFVKSLSLNEELTTRQETLGAGGWRMVCLVAHARDLQKTTLGDDSPEAVDQLLQDVDWASSSDFKVIKQQDSGTSSSKDATSKNRGSKMTEDVLLVHDRMSKADVVPILEQARVQLPKKSPLDAVSKLIMISQKAVLMFIIILYRNQT